MATCYKCGGFKPDYGQCPACAKIASDERLAADRIRSDERLAQEQREANAEIAHQNLKVQAGIAALMALDSQKKHNELMKQEEIRLKELKKQTQILLEQGLTVDEVYQNGFNFLNCDEIFDINEDTKCVRLSLDERGNIYPSYDNPYVQDKFQKAYQKGIEDRVKQDFSKGPGVEFMSDEAFKYGYLRSQHCAITFPKVGSPRFTYYAERQAEFYEEIDQKDGTLKFTDIIYPYAAVFLNQSFLDGIEKYLGEQNTLVKKNQRLAKIEEERAQQNAIQIANDEAAALRAKELAEKESNEKLVRSFRGALFGGLVCGALAAPLFFLVWVLSVFVGGTSWTLIGFIESLAAIGAVIGFYFGRSL
jgi:hypothetical protein